MLMFLVSFSNNKKIEIFKNILFMEMIILELFNIFDKHLSKLTRYYNMIDVIPTSYLSSPNMD